jgi:hypothetical protein
MVTWDWSVAYSTGGAGDTFAQVVSYTTTGAVLATQNATVSPFASGRINWLAVGY